MTIKNKVLFVLGVNAALITTLIVSVALFARDDAAVPGEEAPTTSARVIVQKQDEPQTEVQDEMWQNRAQDENSQRGVLWEPCMTQEGFVHEAAIESEKDIVVLHSGLRVVRNQVIIMINEGATLQQAQEMFARYNLDLIGCIQGFVLQARKRGSELSEQQLKELLTQLNKEEIVQTASINTVNSYDYGQGRNVF